MHRVPLPETTIAVFCAVFLKTCDGISKASGGCTLVAGSDNNFVADSSRRRVLLVDTGTTLPTFLLQAADGHTASFVAQQTHAATKDANTFQVG